MIPRTKNAIRRLTADWILPPAVKRLVFRTLRRRRPPTISAVERSILAANVRLQGVYPNRRCFVLGNGPSLAGVDITPLGGEVTVVMNAFNRHPAIRTWQPVVHCVGEPAGTYDSPERMRFLEEILTGYSTTTHVFPIETKALFDRTGLLPRERLVFIRQDGRVAKDFDHIDLTDAVPSVHDTSVLAVSVAIAMGCNPIVLLGLDYDWLSHRSTRPHFYEDEAVPWSPENLSHVSYLHEMKTAVPRWEAHAALRDIAANQGQSILNATIGSFLDVYPTTTLADVVSDRRPLG